MCDRNNIAELYICGSVHHQSILLNNQHDAALSSSIIGIIHCEVTLQVSGAFGTRHQEYN
jgi:hypothetical protein